MTSPDKAFEEFVLISKQFASSTQLSESDTRAKLIDRILKAVLGWPEEFLKREEHIPAEGYMDYTLKIRERRHINVEAKKEGVSFTVPGQGKHRYLKLSGPLLSDKNISETIIQARRYCSEEGIRYAVVTNGHAWILFRAVREDIPWREGQAVIFSDFDNIRANFTDFWNLLSYEQILAGSLDAEFGSSLRVNRELHRVIDILYNAELPLQRNRLHIQLHPLITSVFEDIADQDQLDILKSCYVHSKSLTIVAKELGVVITDEIPRFLLAEGTKGIKQGASDSGALGALIDVSVHDTKGYLCLLLGGIGAGKTTFLKRYWRYVGKELLEKHALSFTVDFKNAPLDPKELEDFVWKSVLEQIRKRYSSLDLELRKNLKNIFKAEIHALEQTILKHAKRHTEEYEKLLSPYLEKWQSNTAEFVPKLLAPVKPQRNLKIVLFLDNVDQLSPAYQAQIFLLAQRLTKTISSITVVALREESYYTSSVQRAFTAFTNHKFHIASPLFLAMIRNRIEYSRKLLERASEVTGADGVTPIEDSRDIMDYLKITEDSVLGQSKQIVHFIEALCFGNMRLALQMFTTFLASGATDVHKMLHIFRRDGDYIIAYHEFVKSIMLGDRKYYKESSSPIMNVFDCGIEKNSSHFTAHRILHLLVIYRSHVNTEGKGYFDIGQAAALFEDIFDNREDFTRVLNKLVVRQLIEVNTRSIETATGASHIRITSAGWYYLTRLVQSFVYLDLVLQDTPFNQEYLAQEFRTSVYKVDNLYDPEEDKVARLRVRFTRVERFIRYLEDEEEEDFKRYGLSDFDSFLNYRFTPAIRNSFEAERDRISRRVAENRERFIDDTFAQLSEADATLLESLLDETAGSREPE